jgi:hypothetical protein
MRCGTRRPHTPGADASTRASSSTAAGARPVVARRGESGVALLSAQSGSRERGCAARNSSPGRSSEPPLVAGAVGLAELDRKVRSTPKVATGGSMPRWRELPDRSRRRRAYAPEATGPASGASAGRPQRATKRKSGARIWRNGARTPCRGPPPQRMRCDSVGASCGTRRTCRGSPHHVHPENSRSVLTVRRSGSCGTEARIVRV